jgi:enterochelin esterase-like enzyme
MSPGVKTSRTHVWLEGLGEWSWPGCGGAVVEVLPPSWVPMFPPLMASVPALPTGAQSWRPQRTIPRRLATGALLSGLAAACAALALTGPVRLLDIVGVRTQAHAVATVAPSAQPDPGGAAAALLPTLVAMSHDAAGSSIDGASYTSHALRGSGSFLVYLPPGYASTTRHYPVLYLLHGNNQPATAFLEIGLQGELDRLIARHAIPPLIAVMIEGGQGADNWRNIHGLNYESYVIEAQELVDRMLPTIAGRDGRAIAGDSMGGYGAMNVVLGHPDRFSVVESWLGFFNGLEGQLRADRPILSRIGLHAFMYGGESDDIADPSENAPFAAALRAAGVTAHSAVYPGGHSLEMIESHLGNMLVFAGHALSPAPRSLLATARTSAERTAG